MSDGMELLWIVVFVVVGAPLGAAFVLWKQMKAFGRPDLALKPANQSRHGKAMADSQSHDAWFVSQGFDIVACSTLNAMGNVLITAWQHRERPTYICIYHIANQRNYDIVTRFNSDIALTTGSTADGGASARAPGMLHAVLSEDATDEDVAEARGGGGVPDGRGGVAGDR